MLKMRIDYTKIRMNWKKYIERKNPITYLSIVNRAYGKLLFERTGFGFRNQIYSYVNSVCSFYKPVEELDGADSFFYSLIKKDKGQLKQIYEECLSYVDKENELVNTFSMEPSTQWIASNYTLVREDFEKIFLYLTTIPAVILTAAEKNIAESKEAINLFHNFRNTSRVPLQSLVLEKIWKAASEISGIGELNYFTYFTADELSSLFNGGKIPSKEEIEKRKTFCTFYDDKGNIIFNYDCSFLDKIGIKKEEMPLDDKITGNISFKGLVVGTVKIVNKPVDMAKFNDGDIVVSINTSPNIMPVLRKCKAIITDEGGLMCHASIISRELKIPTIVGTKIATKWLKDGDLVEVDADNGIVRKMR